MSEWIKCGLPWDTQYVLPDMPPYPEMDDKVKAHFGYTEKEMEQSFFPGVDMICDHPYFEEETEIRWELEEKYPDDWQDRLNALDNDAVKTVEAWVKARKEIEAWEDDQPEVIAWNDEYDRIYAEQGKQRSESSFCGAGLNKPGTLIERKDGDDISYMVIGHINAIGGSCDDCRGISDDTMILRYKVLWDDGQTTQTAAQ